jgi:hypothetical protein
VTLLDEHASLLAGMGKACENNGELHDLVYARLNTTESLLATFKQSTESLQEVTKREEPVRNGDSATPQETAQEVPIRVIKVPKSQKAKKPEMDPSGLFSIDTNPTPVDQLYKENSRSRMQSGTMPAKLPPKRKAEEALPRMVLTTNKNSTPKKAKTVHVEAEQSPSAGPPPPTVEDDGGDEEQPPADKGDDEDDDFVKRVEARTRARDLKKKQKENKKRKRESAASSESLKPPQTKKTKDRHETSAASVQSEPASAEKGSKEKRLRAEADLDGEVEQVNGKEDQGSRKKKRVKSRSKNKQTPA